MKPHKFRFRKLIKRRLFTTIFGSVGKRRTLTVSARTKLVLRFKLQTIRRAHQGHRNKTFASACAVRVRLLHGRYPVAPQLRR